MPRIRVEWLEGRTHEQRRALVDVITAAVQEIARVRRDQVTIVFDEIPRRLQAKGGVFWSDIDAETGPDRSDVSGSDVAGSDTQPRP